MISKTHIAEVLQHHFDGNGLFLVALSVSTSNKISVIVDSIQGVTVEQVVAVSRAVEGSLDREAEDFELEVSSPGLGEPFKVVPQYQKNTGREVEVLLTNGTKYKGTLLSADTERFRLVFTEKVKPEGQKKKIEVERQLDFGYPEVKSTKIVIKFK